MLTAAFLWPAIVHFRDRVLSEGGDGSTFLWAWWAMPRALLDGHDPFVTRRLFFPVGGNLAFHTTAPLEMAVSWPVARVLGLAAALNFLQVAAVFLSAVGAYLLAFHVCADRRAAFFAGAAFAFVPYRFVHMGGHFNLIHAEFLPFGALVFLRFLDHQSRRRAALVGLLLGLTFLTDFYYLVFLLLALGVIALSRRRDVGRGTVRRLAEAAVVTLVVALPLLVPMVAAMRSGELDALPGWGGADVFVADAVSWLLPPARHPLWGSWVASAREGLPAAGEGIAYPGLVVLGLAVAGRELGVRSARKGWVALAVVAGLLAMGPFLQIGGRTGGGFSYLGRTFSIPLPYFAVHFVPLLNGVRVPGRFAIVAILALDVLAAVTLASLARRRPRWGWALCAGALAVTLVEFLPGTLSQHPAAVPEPYHRIAADGGSGALLEVPLQWQSGTDLVGDGRLGRDDTIFLYYATVHGRPLVSGYLSRYPADRLARLTAVPLYRQVLALGDEPGFDDAPTFDAADLRRQGIGYVVYHRDRPWPAAFAYLSGLGLRELADDGTVVAWKVP
ncbi:MAG TPA: hypothetical protein VHM89_12905 [Acidimicrobiales bacterium]|nr:hypothetical protein [Acidimicrobiales bacterium]